MGQRSRRIRPRSGRPPPAAHVLRPVPAPRSMTAVDVGVVTWNTRELSVAALRRLLDSDQGCQVRLLVRDNGSTDGTAEAVASAVPEASLEEGRQNLGFAAGMNTLIRRSTASWFFALHLDARPET